MPTEFQIGYNAQIAEIPVIAEDFNMRSWIICGWYTPDYAHWADRLRANLNAIGGAPNEFVEVPKRDGGWEANTMAKPLHVLSAMDRHPDKTIIFLDVDCAVCGTIQELDELAAISGDVGVYIRTRFRTNGDVRFGPRSGTLVIRPTSMARKFVETWIDTGMSAPRFAVDQDSLKVALGKTPGLSVTTLDVSACATRGDSVPLPLILHDKASADAAKAGAVRKIIHLLGIH